MACGSCGAVGGAVIADSHALNVDTLEEHFLYVIECPCGQLRLEARDLDLISQ